ncbi:AAA family ATPase [Lactiplantibacillus daowaiensis]|uniref:Nuclease SbcCD subunit C n=1 Tax=Lactiplantibacillus daowaiensis TaxID=2559918 RepID=A0ABW1S1H6_9LACO|nr:SMC family ATPase [Lactiplantibacillus daowaiensis]
MRPLSLTLDYFGPYRHQTIDFTKFNDFPVFLISGKTGAGKTTIFDAMCFALFGGTSGGDRDVRQMRSDFATDDETTQVTFEFEHQGKVYQLVREPEQVIAKKRGEGTHKQIAKVTLTVFDDAGTEVDQMVKVNAVQAYIRDLLQLTREQFSQIVLLPQGQFRQFLMANSDDKEKVLRDIFGTSLYSRWAQQLKQQLKQQQAANQVATQTLKTYQQQLTWPADITAEVADLAPQAAVDRQLTIQATQTAQQTELAATLTAAKAALKQAQANEQVGQTLHDNHLALQRLQADQQTLIDQQATITAKRAQIKVLDWGQTLATPMSQLKAAQQQVAAQTAVQAELRQQQTDLALAETAAQADVQAIAAQAPAAKKRQALIVSLTAKKDIYQHVDTTKAALATAQQALKQAEDNAQQLTQKVTQLTTKQATLTTQGAALPELLKQQTALTTQRRDLEDLVRSTSAVEDQQRVIDQQKQALVAQQATVAARTQAASAAEATYQQLDSDWASAQIAVLSQRLKPGTPCPVCGATTHPKPAATTTTTVTEAAVKAARLASTKAATTLAEAKSQLTNLQAQLTAAQTQLADLVVALKQAAEAKLPMTYTTLAQLRADMAITQTQLLSAQMTNQRAQTKAQTAQDELKRLMLELTAATNQQATQATVVTTTKQTVVKLQTQLADQQQQLSADFKTLSELETYLSTLTTAQNEYEQAQAAAQAKLQQVHEQQSAVTAKQHTTADYLAAAQATVTEQTAVLTTAMTEAWGAPDFDRLTQLLATLSQLADLRTAVQTYDQQWSQLTGQLATLKQAIADRPVPDLAQLTAKTQAAVAHADQVEAQYYELSQTLQANQQLVRQMQATLTKVHDQQADLAAMAQLSAVANGTGQQKLSLERFVLQTYLQKVLVVGNTRLQQLTGGRYQFQLDAAVGTYRNGTGLEINVYDDNAGKVRSVHTLSGGESFIAALSLALALAEVIQTQAGGIKIDALFIDEGFGSLDEDALAMAMEALQTVEGQSRMIGIISHVSELEEQLPAQLQVIPDGNGESHIKYQLSFD